MAKKRSERTKGRKEGWEGGRQAARMVGREKKGGSQLTLSLDNEGNGLLLMNVTPKQTECERDPR
jgi:hypothetical protein